MSYLCACGKEYETVASYGGHCAHCKVHLGHDPIDTLQGYRAWNKGKCKDTDERIARAAEALRNQYKNGTLSKSFLGKTHTDETKKIMSEKAKINARMHKNGWKCGDSHIQNKYEHFTEQFLKDHNIQFESEVTMPQSKFNKKGSYYQFDFLIEGRIDLEIDGTSHRNELVRQHDWERDLAVSQQYQVYRIIHNDSIEELYAKLLAFLEMLGLT